jgi:hypothetical protein
MRPGHHATHVVPVHEERGGQHHEDEEHADGDKAGEERDDRGGGGDEEGGVDGVPVLGCTSMNTGGMMCRDGNGAGLTKTRPQPHLRHPSKPTRGHTHG